MHEPLSEIIRIRVTPSHAARLGESAALSGLSLSDYIRRRLSADDTLQEELTLLRQIVADLGHLSDTRLATSDTQVFKYALPLVAAGWLVAAYHNLLYVGVIPEALQPCGAGPSCAKADLNLFGFISIPLLSLVAFTTLAVLLIVKKGPQK